MTRRPLTKFAAALGAVIASIMASAALAQNAAGVPNAVQGFSTNRDKPVQITAASLEVRDRDSKATFRGAVQVVQGDTTLKCKTLDVYYEPESDRSAKSGHPGPSGQQQIRKLVAKSNVTVIRNDQTATGDNGVFDMKANTIILTGQVVLTQGQNVVRGDRLVVDLTTGVSRVQSTGPGENRVQGLFLPNSAKGEQTGSTGPTTAADAPKPQSRSGPRVPLKLN
jgi:lipopolysaccharide export system protein LptA